MLKTNVPMYGSISMAFTNCLHVNSVKGVRDRGYPQCLFSVVE